MSELKRRSETAFPFHTEEFASPPGCFYPAFTWTWNDKITEEDIRDRLDNMKKAGIRPMLHGFIISVLVVIVALLVEMGMGIV